MPVTVEHAMWHVLTTWAPAQRIANVLVVVDVSGSMGDPLRARPSSDRPRSAGHRAGRRPATGASHLGLWQFGSRLAPPDDYRQLVPTGPF